MKKYSVVLAAALLSLSLSPVSAKHHYSGHNGNNNYNQQSGSNRNNNGNNDGGYNNPVGIPAPSANIPKPQVISPDVKGQDLFNALHEYTSNHTSLGYGTAKMLLPTKVDAIEQGGKTGVICHYSQVFVPCSGKQCIEKGDENGDGHANDFVNVEHTWPQSFFNKNEPMRSDMHQLLLTLSVPNGRRGHMPFSVVAPGNKDDVQYTTGSGSQQTSEYFEPNNESKGNVARALLYFAVTYTGNNVHAGTFNSNGFWDSKIAMLLEWNRQDPPDAQEKHRNDVIASYQGKRNPFIDDPSLADKIGMEVWKAMQ